MKKLKILLILVLMSVCPVSLFATPLGDAPSNTELDVVYGGTGLSSLLDHSLYVGSGASDPTSLGVASNGQIPIGSTGADPVLAVLTGTVNQITVTNGAGTITLSTPQDIDTGASPTFTDLSLQGGNFYNTAPAAGDAVVGIFSDAGTNNADFWRLIHYAADNTLKIETYASGSWVDVLSLKTNGEIQHNTFLRQYTGQKALTDGSATGIFEVAIAAGEVAGGSVKYSIEVKDGTDLQIHSGLITFAGANKAGTVSSDIDEVYLAASETEIATAGTLLDAWTVTDGAAKITINLNANTSLTPTSMVINYTVYLNSANVITPL